MTDDELKEMLSSMKLGPEIYDGIDIGSFINGDKYKRIDGRLELPMDRLEYIPDDTRVMYWATWHEYSPPAPAHKEHFTTWRMWNFLGMDGNFAYMDEYTDRYNGSAVEVVGKSDAIGIVLNAIEYLGEPTAYNILVGNQKLWYTTEGVIMPNIGSDK